MVFTHSKINLFALPFILLWLVLPNHVYGSEDGVLYLAEKNPANQRMASVEVAAEFLGLKIEILDAEMPPTKVVSLPARPVALIIDCSRLGNPQLIDQLDKLSDQSHYAGILVTGCSGTSNSDLARVGLRVSPIQQIGNGIKETEGSMVFADNDFNQELAGQQTRITTKKLFGFVPIVKRKEDGYIPLVSVKTGEAEVPVMLKREGTKLYFSTTVRPRSPGAPTRVGRFVESFPEIMFLKHVLGDRVWHRVVDQANVTIDDPWLINPYGGLNYGSLLNEMKQVRYHTTIAFVPWNFNRSRKDVVRIFLENSKYFSVAIHGNNHDGDEFRLKDGLSETVSSTSFKKALTQALSRMEEFTALTGIPHDRVMVFPHSIGPSSTFPIMGQLGYQYTVNAKNWPRDVKDRDTGSSLRVFTDKFAGFASVRRYGLQVEDFTLAMDLYLDNPVLLYGHQWDFFDDIGIFNRLAKKINVLNKNVLWQSLGAIGDKLFLTKKVDENTDEVRMYSGRIVLQNPTGSKRSYHVYKDKLPVAADWKMVDGQGRVLSSEIARASENRLEAMVTIEPSGSTIIRLIHHSIPEPATDIETSELHVWMVRLGIDFRDLVLSRIPFGRWVVSKIYTRGVSVMDFIAPLILALILVVVSLSITIWVLSKRKRTGEGSQ